METITKLEGARRHLDEAIKLFFEDRDPLAIYTLASAAQGTLRDIAKATGAEHLSISAGAYGRKVIQGRDAKFVYNHIVCPGLLTYLADASGVSRRLVREAKRVQQSGNTSMQQAGEIRRIVPWQLVADALFKNGYIRAAV